MLKTPKVRTMDRDLMIRIRETIDDLPAYGVRRIHAIVRNWDGMDLFLVPGASLFVAVVEV
jgi:hypothetical protein